MVPQPQNDIKGRGALMSSIPGGFALVKYHLDTRLVIDVAIESIVLIVSRVASFPSKSQSKADLEQSEARIPTLSAFAFHPFTSTNHTISAFSCVQNQDCTALHCTLLPSYSYSAEFFQPWIVPRP